MSAFVIFGLPKIVKIFREFNIKKYAPRTNFKRIILKPKLQLIFLVLGILVYRHFIGHFIGHLIGHLIVKHQKTIKNEMRENQPKDFGRKFIIAIHMSCFKHFLSHLYIFFFPY
jgi:hypothetical protein